MNRYLLIVLVVAMLLISASKPRSSQVYYFDYENVLGTSFQLKIVSFSEAAASKAEHIALEEIDRLSAILSTYDSTSEFCRWQKTLNTDVHVSSEFFEVLTLFDQWKLKTGGALSASVGVASVLWKKASVNQILPSAKELAATATAMNKSHWKLNYEKQTATHLSTDPLVFNSFVKSYILDKASKKIMCIPGISTSTLNIGGDIVVAGNEMERIRISDPKADAENDAPVSIVQFKDKAIATSGNYRRGFRIGDVWYSHIMDVRTAVPAREIISATVMAENPTDAGALATAFNILTLNESEELAKQIPGIEYLIITNTGEQIASAGWKALEVMTIQKKEVKDTDFELAINIELARFEGRSHRPFVAVWVENKKKESVRNISLWFNKPRWLPDLKHWYSKNYSNQKPGQMESISSATRSAGKYTLKWDGKDDEGNPVKSGKYTIYIEAAREHGTYQLIKHEIDWNGKPQQIDLEGGVEITSASLDYHQITPN